MKTLTDLKEEFLGDCESSNYSSWTIYGYTKTIRVFICYLETMHNIRTASGLKIEAVCLWRKQLTEHCTKYGFPLKPGSINTQIVRVKVFLRYLIRKHYITSAFDECIDYVKEPKLLFGTVLEHVEIKNLLRSIPTDTSLSYRDRTMLELLYSSGIRAGELIGLDIDDICFPDKTAKVLGKGKKERMIPIGKTAFYYLENYIKAVKPFLPAAKKEENIRALFLTARGRRFDHSSLSYVIRKYTVVIDKKISTHTFRRSCATELIRGGANIYHVKELLGHESLGTLKHYVKLTINDLKKTHAEFHPREKDN